MFFRKRKRIQPIQQPHKQPIDISETPFPSITVLTDEMQRNTFRQTTLMRGAIRHQLAKIPNTQELNERKYQALNTSISPYPITQQTKEELKNPTTNQPIVWLDKHGLPIEFIKGKPFTNLIRFLLHTKLKLSFKQRGRWQYKQDYGLVDTWCKYDYSIPSTTSETTKKNPKTK